MFNREENDNEANRNPLPPDNHLDAEQYVAGLTDFGPGRSKLFRNSSPEYLKEHHCGSSECRDVELELADRW